MSCSVCILAILSRVIVIRVFHSLNVVELEEAPLEMNCGVMTLRLMSYPLRVASCTSGECGNHTAHHCEHRGKPSCEPLSPVCARAGVLISNKVSKWSINTMLGLCRKLIFLVGAEASRSHGGGGGALRGELPARQVCLGGASG